MSSFLDFIKQDTSTQLNEDTIDIIENDTIDEVKHEIQIKGKFSFSKNDNVIKQMNNPNHNTFNEYFFKKGNFIKVIRTPRKYQDDDTQTLDHSQVKSCIRLEQHIRLCDLYCGYIGEIKQFFKGDDSALVILHALNNLHPITFPIECLIKID